MVRDPRRQRCVLRARVGPARGGHASASGAAEKLHRIGWRAAAGARSAVLAHAIGYPTIDHQRAGRDLGALAAAPARRLIEQGGEDDSWGVSKARSCW